MRGLELKTLGIGLIGTGYMGKCHALAWNSVAATFGTDIRPRLVHLGEVNEALAKQRATEFGFSKSSGDWRAVIDDPDVQIVSITSPNQFHKDMTIAALEAGKHVWCEKPMSTRLEDGEAMLAAAERTDRLCVLGYNYIQSPAFRQIETLVKNGRIGRVTNIRVEMDEDFMAAPDMPHSFKHRVESGYGALDDFAVHPLSLLQRLCGLPVEVMADAARPFKTLKGADNEDKPVETFDIAAALMRFRDGLTGTLIVNRSAWGRKGRIALQIFGTEGAILFDQERANEFQLYLRSDDAEIQGFRTILIAPVHTPYNHFIPAPGHGLGFNELKVIEANEILKALSGETARLVDFSQGIQIERVVHAMASSHASGKWTRILS
ncbi:Gfo/Idh/MocA family protein [Rhizobium herbae]|uniref:Dehydrogenase n=1 Tax=Rhizobium herbae TaxID=508661 RepID=A0ABS4EN23_9HYPH|nr:Gfo/Idh/MocA family oxidoreductase [Rhizobium herbae]MBP1859354.1 putative dehydrogenase [Rhizobium herbae]